MFTLLALVVAIIMQQYPTAFVFSDVTPPHMLGLGNINIVILEPINGQWVHHCISSTIEHYVIWLNPPRPPMYWVRSNNMVGMFDQQQLLSVECPIPTAQSN
jgi:hypothetical protein